MMFDRLRKREKEARRCWKRSGVVTSPQSPLPSTPRDRPTPPKPLPRHNPPTFPIRGYLRLSMPISYPPRANARGVRAALLPDHMPSLKPDRRAPCTVVTPGSHAYQRPANDAAPRPELICRLGRSCLSLCFLKHCLSGFL